MATSGQKWWAGRWVNYVLVASLVGLFVAIQAWFWVERRAYKLERANRRVLVLEGARAWASERQLVDPEIECGVERERFGRLVTQCEIWPAPGHGEQAISDLYCDAKGPPQHRCWRASSIDP